MSTTKVVIIDKQPLFRVGVKQAFTEQPDFKIVEASPDDNLSMIIEEDLPDVILLDIDAPSLSGLKIGKSIIRRVARGEYPINDSLLATPTVAEHVLKQFQEMVSMGMSVESVTAPLTNRETQILRYVADGNSNKKIAQILDISEQTIKNHVSSILRKLNANDRAHAVVLAIRRGWISAND